MALLLATASKTASDAASIQTRSILSSLIMGVIAAKILAESTRTDKDERTYIAYFEFNGDINGRTSPVEIIQSDNSRVLVSDVENALLDSGYKTYCRSIKTRDGKPDKIKLQVAWN